MLRFAQANLLGSLKNRVMMGVALFTPLLLLLLFWLVTGATNNGMSELMRFILPGVVVFVVVQTGGTHATTIVTWRENGVFKRLACTPVPLWKLIFGRSLSHLVVTLLQALVVIFVGSLLVSLELTWTAALLTIPVLAIGAISFIALGTIIGAVSPNATVATTSYLFLTLPLLFLGGTLMPPSIFPESVQQIGSYLPTAPLTDLVRDLLTVGTLPEDWVTASGILAAYTVGFTALSARLLPLAVRL